MRADEKESASSQVAREILRYLIANPDAKDTLEGITTWWCPNSGVEREEVQKVLELLVSKGWLTERETRPVETIYGMNKNHREEIERFLHQPKS